MGAIVIHAIEKYQILQCPLQKTILSIIQGFRLSLTADLQRHVFVCCVPEADERKALINLATAYEHYNVNPPHMVLEYHSLRE